MAQIKNKRYFSTRPDVWNGKRSVPVRNNGRLEYLDTEETPMLVATLHDSEIVQFMHIDGGEYVKVCLDVCGYYTATTRQAMNDYLDALGIRAHVSISPKHETMSVRWHDHECDEWLEIVAPPCGRVTLTIPRRVGAA